MRKNCLPTEFEPAAFGLPVTALPLELEKTSPRKLNFGYLNPAICLFYDFNIIIDLLYSDYITLSVCGPRLWNALPPHIKDAQSTNQFKALLKTYFFKQAYSTLVSHCAHFAC